MIDTDEIEKGCLLLLGKRDGKAQWCGEGDSDMGEPRTLVRYAGHHVSLSSRWGKSEDPF